MDQLTLQRIMYLHPTIRGRVRDAYMTANNKMLGRGVRLRFAYTLRTVEEQNALYAKGRTHLYDAKGRRIGKVTNAKGGQSIHNYGLAWDIVILLDKDKNGTFEAASWDIKADNDRDGISDWMECVHVFKNEVGAEWGGDWRRFKDYPHFQLDFGLGWRGCKAKLDSGDVFTEMIQGKEYKWINL